MADYLLFASAFFASAVAPGADTFLILTRALTNKKLAVAAAAGITVGKVLMLSLAYLGLAALLQASADLLLALKILGAGFLFYKAWRLWSAKALVGRESKGGEFFGALAIGFSNPQPMAFYLSIVPLVLQTTELSVLALIVVVGFSAVAAIYIFLAGRLTSWLAKPTNFRRLNRWLALAFLALAVIVLTR